MSARAAASPGAPRADGGAVLSVRGVVKEFTNVRAVDGISFEVVIEEIAAIRRDE